MGKKRVFAALLALAVTVGSLVLPARAAFTDTTGHWAETAITKWSEEYSIINGYEDGTFRPDNSITRGAFAGILDRFLKFQSTSPAGTFSDLSGNYWEDAILKLHASGVYLGNNGQALAGDTITRQQAVTMIARAFNISGESATVYTWMRTRWRITRSRIWRRCPPWATSRIPPTGTSVPRTPSPGRRS